MTPTSTPKFLKTILFVLLAISGLKGWGQVGTNYSFSTNATGSLVADKNANSIVAGSFSSTIVPANSDDASSAAITFGFTFNFNGTNFTQFSASSNGGVQLGGTIISSTQYGTSGTFPLASTPLLAPYLGDLATLTSTGAIQWQIVGSSPNRTLVIQFSNIRINYGSTTADGTFQVRLYETSGLIEFVYGAMKVGGTSTGVGSTSVVIGINNNTGAGNNITINQSSYASTTTASATVNTNSSTGTITGLNSSADGSRRVFTFTPPFYWNGGIISATPAAGGTGTWSTANAWRVGTTTGSQSTWSNNAPAILAGTAGTVTLGADHIASSIAINTTGYTFTPVSSTTRTLTGPITLANSVNLNLNSFSGTGTLAIGSISGGTSTSLTLTGTNSASTDAQRINLLSGATISSNVPITISTTGSTGISGFVSSSGATGTIAASITNNSAVPTMLGTTASSTLTVTGVVSGSAGVQFSGGSSGGTGTININTAGTWTGATRFNGANNSLVKLGVNNAIPTNSDITMGYDGTNGQILDINGKTQSFQSLSSTSGGTGSITSGAASGALTINQASNTTFYLPFTGTSSLSVTKSGAGIFTAAGVGVSHTFTGGLTINAGEWRWNPTTSSVNIAVPVTLTGGTMSTTNITAAINVTLGTLNVSSGTSTIALGSNGHNLTFAASNGITWNGTALNITGWTGTAGGVGTAGRIFVGATSSGLTAAQLAKITFSGFSYGATILGSGELVPAAASTNADLSALTTTAGSLNNAFSAATTAYTVSVGNTTSSVTVTPTVSDVTATIQVRVNNGTYAAVTSGSASTALTLNVGSNPIDIKITAQDGTTTKTYTITVTRAAVSSNADLSALTNTAGSLNTAFSASTISYTASVLFATTSVTVTPTVSDAAATIQVRINSGTYANVTSGSASSALSLNVGDNPVDVKVTAQDGTTIKTYTITVTRSAASTNADLSALTTTAGALTPTFASATTSYTASVLFASTSVTVTPTKSDANATIQVQVNGGGYSTVISGTASSALSLNVGDNPIDVKVTAQDGTTIKTYTITVTRSAASTNADLSALTTTAGALTPSFASATTSYTASVLFATTSVTVTSTRSDATATIQVQVNGGGYSTVTSGSASSALLLNVGTNPIDVKVTAQDGTTIKTYTITVTRSAASTNADLSALTTTAGTLTPAFASGTISYTASVVSATSSVTVTPTVSDATATIQVRVNGGTYNNVSSGSASAALSLNVGSNPIDVKVTAQDGTTIKTYTITVTRADIAPDQPTINYITPASGSLSINFSAPVANGGSAVTDYKYSTDGGATFKSAGSTSSPIVITTVSGSDASLVNGTSNNVQLRAFNNAGDGAATARVAAVPNAVIYFHNFGTTIFSSKPYSVAPVIKDANINTGSSWTTSQTGSPFTSGNGVSGVSLSVASIVGTNTTFTLTFVVATGYQLNLSAFDFWRSRNSSGAYSNWAITVNGTSVGSGTLPTGGAYIRPTNVATPITGLTGTITLVYTMSSATSVADARLDDFTLYGLVAQIPTLISPSATSVSDKDAILGATISSNGNSPLTARGTVYGTTAAPTGNLLAEGGTTVAAFTHQRTSLTANTLYYYRGYATNLIGTGYSGDGTFVTLPAIPASAAASLVGSDRFTANWTAPTPAGNQTYTYSLQYSNTSDFTSGNQLITGILSSATSQLVTGLSSSTNYWYRVRANNTPAGGGDGGWSDIQTLTTTTVVLPTLTTPTSTTITNVSAFLGATVTSNGGETLTARGTVYGTSANPTGNDLAEGGTGTGAFSQQRTLLNANTLYYYRGYATNSAGTAYTAPDGTFTTLPDAPAAVNTANNISINSFTANWTAPTNVGAANYGYEVQVSTDNAAFSNPFTFTVAQSATPAVSVAATGLAPGTTYYYRVRAVNAGGNGAYTAASAAVNTLAGSTISANAPASGYLSNISTYASFTAASGLTTSNSLAVMGLSLNDLSGDGLNTTLTNISFTIPANTGSAVKTAALFDGTTNLGEVAVSGTSISFSSLSISAADNSSKTFDLRVTFKTAVTDNHQMTFTVSSVTAGSGSSTFAAANGGGAVSSTATNVNTIRVAASQLVFTTSPPATASVSVTLTSLPVVTARDANGNTDLDYTFPSLQVSNTAGLTQTNAQSATNGVLTFTGFQFTSAATGPTGSTTKIQVQTSNFSVQSADIAVTYPNSSITTWSSGSNASAWCTTGNWSNGTPTVTQVAQFANSGTTTNYGVNFGTCTPNILGIEITSARITNDILIGSSSTTSSNITLIGGVINSTPNVILRNNSGKLFTIQPFQTGSGALTVALGNATENIVNVDGTGGISISSVISGAGRNLTKAGSGAGILTLSGVNTYTGTTTVSTGTLVVSKTGYNATITPSTITMAFTSTPSAGTFSLFGGGPLSGSQTFSATGLSSNQTASFNASTSTVTVGSITPATTTLPAFTTTYGTASAVQTVTISGISLTGNIVTSTAPTGYEVSSDGTTYGSTATFPASGGILRIRLSATATVSGSYNAQTITLSNSTATATVTTAASGNIVSPATVTITPIAGQSKVFGATEPTFTYNASPSVTITGALSRVAGENVGTYAYTLGTLSAGSNYTLVLGGSNTFGITPATVTITPMAGQSKVFGATEPTFTYNASPSVTITGALSRVAGENVGTYAYTLGTLSAGSNYTLVLGGSNTFGITPATVTITPMAGQSKVFGATEPTFTYNASPSVTITGALSRVAGENVGTYAYTLGTLSAGSNYTLILGGSNTFGITPATVTITPTAGQSKVYGVSDPIFTYSSSPSVSTTGALARVSGENIASSPFAYTLGSLSAGSNYILVLDGSNSFTITAAPLTITANDQSKCEGQTHSFDGTEFTTPTTGPNALRNGETIGSVTLTSTGTASSAAVNTYSIVPSNATGGTFTANNYAISYVNGTLTVNALPTAVITGTAAICIGGSRVLNANANAGSGTISSYQWNVGGSPIDGATNSTYTASAAGTYTVTVINSNGCSVTSAGFTTTITNTNTFTGPGSFSEAAKWSCGVAPTSGGTTNVVISGAAILDANFAIGTGGSFTILTQGSLVINPNIVLSGTGNIDFNGQPVTILSTTPSSNNNTGGNGSIGVLAADGSNLLNATNVTVERFIPALDNRAYRLMASTVGTKDNLTKKYIRDNWQEEGGTAPLLGTHITGATNTVNTGKGFDVTLTGNPSMFTYNGTNNNFVGIPNTNATNLDAKMGYLLFVRGDRTASHLTASATSSNTTLRATGTLLSGNQIYALRGNDKVSLITNPYASAINWQSIYEDATNGYNGTTNPLILNVYYYLDPNVGAAGNYVTVTNRGIRSNNDPGINGRLSIQPGQAFFIKGSATGSLGTLTIKEAHKSDTANINVFRTGSQEGLGISLFYPLNGNMRNADGVNVLYNNSYAAEVDGNDAPDITSLNEDLSIMRGGKVLSIEGRPLIDQADTIFLGISKMLQKSYELRFYPSGFNAPGLLAYLQDKFLTTETQISLSETTKVPFTVTSNTASSASDRFKIVFRSIQVLPINFTNVKAFEKGSQVQVEWNLGNEQGVKQYEIETSADGRTFTKGGTQAVRSIQSTDNYVWMHQQPNIGSNFYRIKAIEQNGRFRYSQVVSVKLGRGNSTITVYPNPITDNTINVQLVNQPAGKYSIRLLNQLGQELYRKELNHIGGSATEALQIDTRLSKGVYNLQVTGNGKTTVQKVVTQ